MKRIAAVILAAGGSTRMGLPKQLLQINNVSMIRKVTVTALSSQCDAVVVVMGGYADKVESEISDLEIASVFNPDWKEGIASSISAGIEVVINKFPDFDSVIMLLADQPAIDVKILNSLIEEYKKNDSQIIASKYDNAVGVPALFGSQYFDDLLNLHGDNGAKTIINNSSNQVVALSFENALIDIDTNDDYIHYLSTLLD